MMNNSPPKEDKKETETKAEKVTPLRCLMGSTISGALAFALYSLTYAIASTFAAKPITSTNQLSMRISAMVRTLVVGTASLGTFIFAFVTIGLVLLAMQLFIQSLKTDN